MRRKSLIVVIRHASDEFNGLFSDELLQNFEGYFLVELSLKRNSKGNLVNTIKII